MGGGNTGMGVQQRGRSRSPMTSPPSLADDDTPSPVICVQWAAHRALAPGDLPPLTHGVPPL